MMFKLITGLAILALVALAGCGDDSSGSGTTKRPAPTADDVMREASEAAETAGAFTAQSMRDWKDEMAQRLDEASREIDALAARADEVGEDARASFDETMADLRAQRDELKTKLDEASATTAQAWRDVTSGLDRAWTEFDTALRDAAERYGDDGASAGG